MGVPAKLGTDGASETAVIVVNGFLGGEGNPWEIGEGVTAYVKDHVIYLKGEGTVTELGGDGAPWAKYGEMLEGAYLARKVKVPALVAATLPISVKGGVGNPMDGCYGRSDFGAAVSFCPFSHIHQLQIQSAARRLRIMLA